MGPLAAGRLVAAAGRPAVQQAASSGRTPPPLALLRRLVAISARRPLLRHMILACFGLLSQLLQLCSSYVPRNQSGCFGRSTVRGGVAFASRLRHRGRVLPGLRLQGCAGRGTAPGGRTGCSGARRARRRGRACAAPRAAAAPATQLLLRHANMNAGSTQAAVCASRQAATAGRQRAAAHRLPHAQIAPAAAAAQLSSPAPPAHNTPPTHSLCTPPPR